MHTHILQHHPPYKYLVSKQQQQHASKQASTSQKQKPRHSQLVCRNPANSFLMESPSGALNENTNGSSQLSPGGAGRWCEVEKCGFFVPAQKWTFWSSFY